MVNCRQALPLLVLVALSACVQHRPATTVLAAPPVPQSAVSGRVAGFKAESDQLNAKVAEDRQALDDLRAQRSQLSGTYFDHVSTINARLQAGTTPGNPELMALWQQSQTNLTGLDDAVIKLSDLQAKLSKDAAEAGYLANSVRAAFALEGALESDHAQMAEIQSQASSNAVVLDRLLADIADDVNRQTESLAVEHRNLPTLLHAVEIGELLGNNLGAAASSGPPPTSSRPTETAPIETAPEPAPIVAAAAPPEPVRAAPPSPPQRRPQLVVDAAQSPAQYEPALYKAISQTLARAHDANVEVVAVLPGQGPPTSRALATEAVRHKAEAVARALVAFGVSRDHVTTSATQGADLKTGEVWVYSN